ncbi:MAG: hypothetical protein ACM3ZT_07705 [Bacillota bacterium]
MLTPAPLDRARSGAALAALKRVLLHPYTLFTLAALMVWLPDGFNIGPTNDGWIKLETLLSNARIYAISTTRVFGSVPREIGMRLGDGGFQGWQAFLFLFAVLRAGLFYGIVRRLFPARAAFAVGCGLVALFHPADSVYFWVDVTGVHMGLVLTLAACLCALVHLQTGSRAALFAMLLFQLTSCLTYSAFLVLMLAFPVGVWLLHRLEGGKTSWTWLIKAGWLPVAYNVFQVVLVLKHAGGHEAQVADLHLGGILAGYAHETLLFFTRSALTLADFRPVYFLWALPPAVLGLAVARALPAAEGEGGEAGRNARWYLVLCLGLVALAAASYLPYATSSVRLGAQRQLFAAGIFLYMLMLMPLFFWLPRRLNAPQLPWLLVALLAGFVTLTGLEKRAGWTEGYRGEERLLASIAATVPQPPPGTMFVIHLHDGPQAKRLGGFYNRRHTLELALRLMYGDRSLRASFTPIRGPLFQFRDGEMAAVQTIRVNRANTFASYDKVLVLDYAPNGAMRVLDRDWLRPYAPAGTDLSAYAPGDYGQAPRGGAVICAMLEKAMRPTYCQ